MICPNCQAQNDSGALFCLKCGESITEDEGGITKTNAVDNTNHRKVNNIFAWLMAFVPLIGIPLAIILDFGYIFLVLNIILGYIDCNNLTKQGVDTSKFGTLAFFVPYYLYKRAKALGDNLAYFIVWIALFVITLPL